MGLFCKENQEFCKLITYVDIFQNKAQYYWDYEWLHHFYNTVQKTPNCQRSLHLVPLKNNCTLGIPVHILLNE